MSGRLLIIDDDRSMALTIEAIGAALGYQTLTILDPRQLAGQIEAFDPTCIALDLMMPEVDGLDVLLDLARRGCQAALIISSGMELRVIDAAGRAAAEQGLNIVGVLSKPFAPAALQQLLQQAASAPARAPRPPQPVSPAEPITVPELAHALSSGQVRPWFQPKLFCRSGTLCGFEALVRWEHPERGLVPPYQFVPLAEASGLIDQLTDVVLDVGIRWLGTHLRDTRLDMAVNLSALGSLHSPQFLDGVRARCRENGLAHRRLVLEITESHALHNPLACLDLLTRLRLNDFQLAIDDFGTGFSTMQQLVRLPFSEIKIDRSFVMSAHVSESSRNVIEALVELAHNLGISCTAEGVENQDVFDYLGEIGCDRAQGFHLARPMSPEAALEWVQQRDCNGSWTVRSGAAS